MYDKITRVPTYRYRAAGKCIYCGCTEQLTDEHIVPFALGGNLVLPTASCVACADRTKKYEQRTLRATLGNVRIRHNFPPAGKRNVQSPSKYQLLPLQDVQQLLLFLRPNIYLEQRYLTMDAPAYSSEALPI